MAAILDWARANPLKTAAALLALVRIYRTRTAAAAAAAPISGKDKIVVVTGCDSGFGKMLSLRLAEAGFTVAAGCLSDDGIKAFEGKSNIIALKLDVTKDDSVESFKAAVEKAAGDKGVFAIVNNAGLANNFYIEATTIQQDILSFDVNVFGVLRVTRAFLPSLRKYRAVNRTDAVKPRVVMVSSVAGWFAGPRLGAYAATKHALEAYTTALRAEIAPFGITTVSINPYYARTNLIKDLGQGATSYSFETRPEVIAKTKDIFARSPELDKLYDKDIVAKHDAYYAKMMSEGYDEALQQKILEPQQVVDALYSSVTATKPLLRYVVCSPLMRVLLNVFRMAQDSRVLAANLANDKRRGFWPKPEAVMI